MTIFIGADHRGFELKNKLVAYFQEKNIRVEDMGNYEYEANDDYPIFIDALSNPYDDSPPYISEEMVNIEGFSWNYLKDYENFDLHLNPYKEDQEFLNLLISIRHILH